LTHTVYKYSSGYHTGHGR